MKKILLLNPPGQKLYIRDYYCSKISKANYVNHPIDLLVLSGWLSQKYEVIFLDAIMEKLSPEESIERIAAMGVNTIISLIGSVSLNEDVSFLKGLKERLPHATLLCSGDIVLGRAEEKLKRYEFIDGFILDFSSPDIMEYFAGQYEGIQSIIFREGNKIHKPLLSPKHNLVFSLPRPRHELFLKYNYRFPFIWQREFATVLTDFGCPLNCTFCIMGTLGYKYRPVDNVMMELRHLSHLGVRDLFFADQSFAVIRERNRDICLNMIKEGLGFRWFCFSRVDLVDEEFLLLMKKSGCHTIIFGVETADENQLEKYKKRYTRGQVKDAFSLCRRLGITTVGTFLLGLPEETEESALATINFAIDIKADFASFNVAVPREGTELRREAIKSGLIGPEVEIMDQSGETTIVMPTNHISKERLAQIKKEAVRKFYFRVSYLWHRLLKIKSFTQLMVELRNALILLRLNFK